MSLFAIADTHLSFGTDKPMDAFPGWSGYTERLEKNWNRVVSPTDYVVIAGDISWAMNFQELKADFAFLHQLNGTKIILKGNHDYWWNTRKKMELFLEENGFSSLNILHNSAFQAGPFVVCGSRGWMMGDADEQDQKIRNREAVRLQMSCAAAHTMKGEKLAFLHYPPVSTVGTCTELVDILRKEGIQRCCYGHLHGEAGKYAVKQTIDGIHYTLIAADYLRFCPILLEKF